MAAREEDGEEVLRIARKLDKMVSKKNTEGALDLLKQLKSVTMSLDMLESTRIGMSVNALRKQCSEEEVIALSKSLIKSWKKLLDSSEQRGRERSQSSSSSKDESSSAKKSDGPKSPSTPKMTRFPPLPVTSNSVRTKCREMLIAALQTDGDYIAIGSDCDLLAAQIEEAVFEEIQNTDMKYKNRIRSRIANLKDSKNPDLRKNVLCGGITPEQIAVMSCEVPLKDFSLPPPGDGEQRAEGDEESYDQGGH
ncbi:transcription elongation factor A protein 2 isoform X3 [Hyperolius riggenbachi]|uniref:transcription elongation factor A protein 2 isoform X3 n=1 Tax=Hyperolius riggenbachi TaxID=752182 RepID=UPI0035A3BFBA